MAKRFPIACCLMTWGDEQKRRLEECLREMKAAGYDGWISVEQPPHPNLSAF